MKQPFLYVANWKMNSSFEQSLTFCTDNKTALAQLASQLDNTIVLCPSFPALHTIAQLCANSGLHVGAQNCSDHMHGAYTGQVNAQSLSQVGCTYCIIGHSESRTYYSETNEQIGKKVNRLLEQKITPIICIGETQTEYEQNKTYALLEEQLLFVRKALTTENTHTQCVIAYEPIWAIGSGITPPAEYLTNVFSWLREYCTKQLPNIKISLLYGGSVNENNALSLKQITDINGFLIGSASLDFQKLQKIIVCTY